MNEKEVRDQKGRTEAEFLATYDRSRYPNPSLTTDFALFCRRENTQFVLLIKRGGHPFLGKWALPGGFAEPGETVEETAARELLEETQLQTITPELVGVYSKPGRDPRGWVISVLYTAQIDDFPIAKAGDDAREAAWFSLKELPELAFDHEAMIQAAAKHFAR